VEWMWELARVPTPSCSWIGKAALTATALKAKLLTLAKQPPTSPVRIGDGKGLHLLIKSNQGATGAWVLRYTFAGKRKDMGLGAYPAVSLAEARQAAEQARALIRGGTDPSTLGRPTSRRWWWPPKRPRKS
jgi:hypothetical protein